MLNKLYCAVCSGELASTGFEPYSAETYYICPSCLNEYTVTETVEATLIIQTDLKENYQE